MKQPRGQHRHHRRAAAQARPADRRAGRPRGPRAGSRRRDPVRARADDDVRRLAGHRPQGDRRGWSPTGCSTGSTARAPSWPGPGWRAGCTWRRSARTCGAAGSRRRPARSASSGSGRPPTSPRRSTSDATGQAWRIERVRLADGQPIALEQGWYPEAAAARPRPARTSAARSTSCSPTATASPSTPPSRRCGARRPTPRSPGGSTRRVHTPLLVFRRVSRAAGTPLEYVVSRYRGDRYQLHMSLGRDGHDPQPDRPDRERSERGQHRDHTGRQADTGSKKRLQPRAACRSSARSLMLPIAALPVAALLLRLGQPDLLGADGLGWDSVAAVIGAAGNALFANLALLFARRHRDRHGPEVRRLDRAGRRRRLPGLQGRRRRDVAARAGPAGRGRRAGADQLRRPRRHRDGPGQRLPLAALPPDQAAAVPRLLRRPPLRPDHHRVRRDRDLGADELRLPARSTPASPASASGSPRTPCSAASSTAPSTGC